jgi:dimethylamine--corrinoid protein Co-methyltransferase
MEKDILTRMGDGQRVKMSAAQIKEDLLAGTKDAADKGRIPELTSAELEQLFHIIADRNRVVSVEPGEEIVLTDDATVIRANADEGAGGGVGLPISRLLAILMHERAYAQDSAQMQVPAGSGGHVAAVKAKIDVDMQAYETASLLTTIPLFYEIAPSVLWYFRPHGPYDNPADLLPQGKIQEARDASEKAAERLTEDVVYIGKKMYSVGCDALNLDTSASGGDAEFYANLNIVSKLKKLAPHMPVEMGMSGEFIIGVHGQITFNGERLAGMFPHQQVKVAEAAGLDIFGPVVNVNCSKSFPWNLARAVTFVKQTVAESNIPVHVNAGMGVCGVPMYPTPPIDCVSRVAKAMVQLAKVDGL